MSSRTPGKPSKAVSCLDTPPLLADTPVVKRPINSAYPDLATNGLRHLAGKDLQESVRQVSVSSFFQKDGLLPPLPQGVRISSIVKALKEGSNKVLDKDRKWIGFSRKSNFVGTTEDTLFAKLPRIIERIVDASGLDKSKRTLIFECNPTGVSSLFTRDDESKPDCVGRLVTATAEYSKREWIDVAVAGEFKRLDPYHDEMDVSCLPEPSSSSCHILMLTRASTGLCQSLMVRPKYHARRSEKATDLRLYHRRC